MIYSKWKTKNNFQTKVIIKDQISEQTFHIRKCLKIETLFSKFNKNNMHRFAHWVVTLFSICIVHDLRSRVALQATKKENAVALRNIVKVPLISHFPHHFLITYQINKL